MITPEAELSTFAAGLTIEDVPGSVQTTVRRAFLDTTGVILAGAVDGAGTVVFETDGVGVDAAGDPDPATILGLTGLGDSAERALRTGTASHALEYDDL